MMPAATSHESKTPRAFPQGQPGQSGVISLTLVCCAYFSSVGWILSALHELNGADYSVAALVGIAALGVWRRKNSDHRRPRMSLPKARRRFRRLLPGAFLVVAVLVFLGGMLYAPNEYDAMTYRLPRMLNWLMAGRWFWVPTIDERLNYSTVGWEWIAMPLLLLFRSDRGLFLINALSFLLLPGLLFSVFRQSGCPPAGSPGVDVDFTTGLRVCNAGWQHRE